MKTVTVVNTFVKVSLFRCQSHSSLLTVCIGRAFKTIVGVWTEVIFPDIPAQFLVHCRLKGI